MARYSGGAASAVPALDPHAVDRVRRRVQRGLHRGRASKAQPVALVAEGDLRQYAQVAHHPRPLLRAVRDRGFDQQFAVRPAPGPRGQPGTISYLDRPHVRSASAAQCTTRPTWVGRLLFNVLAMVAEFEADLIRLRREGMRIAKAKGRLRGKQPKLNPRQEAHMVALLKSGEYSTAELGDLFGVARSTVYRAIGRDNARQRAERSCTGPIR